MIINSKNLDLLPLSKSSIGRILCLEIKKSFTFRQVIFILYTFCLGVADEGIFKILILTLKDENQTTFENEFCRVFSKRYTILSLMNFSHYVHNMSSILVPQVEMLLATQGRVFVGTQYVNSLLFFFQLLSSSLSLIFLNK